MLKPLKTILFATNLTENCRAAFEFAASIATQYQTKLVLLHVLEKKPDYIMARLKGLIGEEQWLKISQGHVDNAREVLIGKKSSSRLVQAAMNQFCINEGIDDNSCGYHSKEIVVVGGELVEEIINQIMINKADLLVMGSRDGFLSDNRIGQTIKSVMRKSRIPVTVVPAYQ